MAFRNKTHRSEETGIERTSGQAITKPESGATTPENYYTPLMDIAETGDSYLLQADLPGVNPGDVDVSYHDGTLTIQAPAAQRQKDHQRYIWQEYGVGKFYRTVNVGNGINPDGIRAELKDGVLSVFVPKAEAVKARKIEVKSS